MSTTRAQVLRALRQWGQPVRPIVLAEWISQSPLRVADCLSALYSRDLIDREPQVVRDVGQRGRNGFLYRPKELQS